MGQTKGFILIATLWILALLTLAAGFFALWTQKTVATIQNRQADLQGEIDMYNTQSILFYLLATQHFTIGGLTVSKTQISKEDPTSLDDLADDSKSLEEIMDEYIEMQRRLKKQRQEEAMAVEAVKSILSEGTEIGLDDRPYLGQGKAYFALQDLGGLFNIQFESDFTFGRLLGLLGIKSELHESLIAKLRDYVDIDDLHRLNGAESYHYEQRHLPPPSNRFLITPMETYRILDWAEQSNLWEHHQFGQLTYTKFSLRPNFNTAPSLVLQAAYNLSATSAKRIIKTRRIMPFYNLHDLTQIAGTVPYIDPFETNFFPTGALRLTLWYDGGQRMRQIYLQYASFWRIEYSFDLELLPIYTETPAHEPPSTLFTSAISTKTQ